MSQKHIQNTETPRSLSLGIVLILTGIVGWISSFQLTLDKLKYLADPNAVLSCNFGLTVQCGANLNSAQGELFGFPNPLLGIAAFIVPILFGVLVLAKARIPRWIWLGFNLGVALGFIWVLWFAYQSIYILASLCPWCMTMWLAMIPLFYTVTFWNLKAGHFGEGLRKIGKELYTWTWVFTVVSYFVIALLAQLELDVINRL
ncbi:MAG: vitamin K epoxide reductase family protein [Microbacteriaceae bacterium]